MTLSNEYLASKRQVFIHDYFVMFAKISVDRKWFVSVVLYVAIFLLVFMLRSTGA